MDLEQLGFEQLVDALDDLEGRRTPIGWAPEDAVVKTRVERRMLDLVMAFAGNGPPASSSRVSCNMRVVVRTKRQSFPGTVLSIGSGGALVQGVDLPLGTHVHLKVRSTSDEYDLHVRAQVAWRESEPASGVGVTFAGQPSEAHERRVRRFVLELLRFRTFVT
jgi:hypothetical protein